MKKKHDALAWREKNSKEHADYWQMGGGKSQYDVSETVRALHHRINYMIRWMPGLHTGIHKIGKIKACIGFRWYLLLDGFTSSPGTVILYWIIGLYLAVCPLKLECPFKRKWAGALPELSKATEEDAI